MTDLSTLTDTEINGRLEIAQGKPFDGLFSCGKVYADRHFHIFLACSPPEYTTSLDALKSGPEAMLREAGWVLAVTGFDDDSWSAEWWKVGRDFVLVSAPTEARARAEAVCLGLEASK